MTKIHVNVSDWIKMACIESIFHDIDLMQSFVVKI